MKINIKKENDSISLPKFQTSGAAGFDLEASEDTVIMPGKTTIVKTGLSFEIPEGYELQIRPRSGVTVKTKLRVCLGTVDSDYRGEVGIIVDNIGSEPINVKKNERLAQGVIAPVVQAVFEMVDFLNETERGAAGFGSTGVTARVKESVLLKEDAIKPRPDLEKLLKDKDSRIAELEREVFKTNYDLHHNE